MGFSLLHFVFKLQKLQLDTCFHGHVFVGFFFNYKFWMMWFCFIKNLEMNMCSASHKCLSQYKNTVNYNLFYNLNEQFLFCIIFWKKKQNIHTRASEFILQCASVHRASDHQFSSHTHSIIFFIFFAFAVFQFAPIIPK